MKRISSHLIGIDQGEDVLFSDFEDGGDMWTGAGPRERRHRVEFSQAYRSAPSVQVALSMWDMHHATNVRADIAAENIDPKGFEGGVPDLGRHQGGAGAGALDGHWRDARRR